MTLGKGMSKWKRTDTKTREPHVHWRKVQGKAKAKARNEHLKHVCVVARKDTRKQTANSRLRHVQTAERLVT